MDELNSLITLEEIDQYHLARLTPGWGDQPLLVRAAAAVRATEYIDFTYEFGDTADITDARLKRAVCALAALLTDHTGTEPATADVLVESGSGIGSITYAPRPSDPYPAITAMLRGIAVRNGGGFRSARVII